MSEIADSIHYVALETNKNCLVSIGLGYAIESGFVFVQGRLLFFSPEGKFLNNIGSIGKGAGEYIPAAGTSVDGETGTVYVRSRGNLNIFVKYSLAGKYTGTVHNRYIADGAKTALMDSAIVMVYPVQDKRYRQVPDIVVYNTALDSVTASRTIDYDITAYTNTHNDFSSAMCFSFHPKCVYYKTTYNDTLYLIKKNEISPAMLLDFGNYAYSKENIYQRKKNPFRNTVLLRKMRRVENRFFFNCAYTDNNDQTTGFMYVCDVDGKNGKYLQPVFTNDLDNGPSYMFPDHGNITAVQLDNMDDDNRHFYFPDNRMSKKMKNRDQFTELYQKTKVMDNPILQVIHFKDK